MGLVVDAKLNVQLLKDTLFTLVEHKFPRAGARLTDQYWSLEFHIPHSFNSENPPVAFTADHYCERYGSRVRPGIPGLFKVSGSEPSTCLDIMDSNTPVVHVHVTVFEDLTFIGVTYLQVMFDVPGLHTLLSAWTRLLAGDTLDAIRGMGRHFTPFDVLQGPPVTLEDQGVRGHSYFAPDYFSGEEFSPTARVKTWLREEVNTLIRVPKAFLDQRIFEIIHDLKLNGFSEFPDTCDILLAWWLKVRFTSTEFVDSCGFQLSYSHRPSNDKTLLTVHIPVNLRSMPIFMGESALTEPYINNASSTIPAPECITIHTLQAESLGDISLRIHRAIKEYHKDLVTAQEELRWREKWPMRRLHRGLMHHKSALFTNLTGLSDLDFSGAAFTGGDSQGNGRILFVTSETKLETYMPGLRGTGELLIEDADAFWLSQVKTRKEWDSLCAAGTIQSLHLG
ncbi:hypothetical protein FB45DRAFT_1028524 [Roridomyces roridus]|uniref:Uncharacterized protein n=1 Tax=Roridomyces roridus TaxID=1738132 RepID=A0AAD7FJV8_9AGAR|nr:hypothetical protein FB45DRAFT_1028524 [Roridomyces roridus]